MIQSISLSSQPFSTEPVVPYEKIACSIEEKTDEVDQAIDSSSGSSFAKRQQKRELMRQKADLLAAFQDLKEGKISYDVFTMQCSKVMEAWDETLRNISNTSLGFQQEQQRTLDRLSCTLLKGRHCSSFVSSRSSDPSPLASKMKSLLHVLASTEEVLEKIRPFALYSLMKHPPQFTYALLDPESANLASVEFAICAIHTAKNVIGSVWEEASLQHTALQSRKMHPHGETIVYLLPKKDSNASSHWIGTHDDVKKLLEQSKDKQLVVARVDSLAEIEKTLQRQKNISHLWMAFHGSRMGGIELSREDYNYPAEAVAHFMPRDSFKEKVRVTLKVCYGGTISMDGTNFAGDLQASLGDSFTVTASTASIQAVRGVKVEDGKVSFLDDKGKDVTVEYPVIQPLDDLSDDLDSLEELTERIFHEIEKRFAEKEDERFIR